MQTPRLSLWLELLLSAGALPGGAPSPCQTWCKAAFGAGLPVAGLLGPCETGRGLGRELRRRLRVAGVLHGSPNAPSSSPVLCSAGTIIKPGDVKCVPNEGMPVYRNPTHRGKLVIQFQVRRQERGLGALGGLFPSFLSWCFCHWRCWGGPTSHLTPFLPCPPQVRFPEPGWLPTHQLRQFQAFFPHREEVMATEDTEEVELREYFPQPEFGGQRRFEAYHEDDLEDPLRHNVQCQAS